MNGSYKFHLLSYYLLYNSSKINCIDIFAATVCVSAIKEETKQLLEIITCVFVSFTVCHSFILWIVSYIFTKINFLLNECWKPSCLFEFWNGNLYWHQLNHKHWACDHKVSLNLTTCHFFFSNLWLLTLLILRILLIPEYTWKVWSIDRFL